MSQQRLWKNDCQNPKMPLKCVNCVTVEDTVTKPVLPAMAINSLSNPVIIARKKAWWVAVGALVLAWLPKKMFSIL